MHEVLPVGKYHNDEVEHYIDCEEIKVHDNQSDVVTLLSLGVWLDTYKVNEKKNKKRRRR